MILRSLKIPPWQNRIRCLIIIFSKSADISGLTKIDIAIIGLRMFMHLYDI